MKYIKTYKVFESNGDIKYQFFFPVMKHFTLKEDGYWNWSDICKYLKSESGMDLKQDIADESEEEIDKRNITDDDIDEYVENYGNKFGPKGKGKGSWDKFKEDYCLDFDDSEINDDDYDILKDDFNEGELEQWFNKDFYNREEPIEIINLRIIDDPNGRDYHNNVYGEFESANELTEEQIKLIEDYISGQCSDGWGESFSQIDRVEEISNLRFDTSIICWWSGSSHNRMRSGNREWKVNISKS